MRGLLLLVPALAVAASAKLPAAVVAVAPATLATLDRAAAIAFTAERIPPRVADRQEWARDVVAALEAAGRDLEPSSICAVLAVVDLTSEFNPSVRLDRWGPFDFAAMLERQLGPGRAAWVRRALALRDPATGAPFRRRFETARDEAELDRAVRDTLAAARSRAPVLVAAAEVVARWGLGVRFAELNPVRTAGPMQISVAWAARATGTPPGRLDELRDLLFTRAGGLRLGVARLFAVAPSYRQLRFLFADFNAGPYASRNAAFQQALVELTGVELQLDGDLMRYDTAARPVGRSNTLAALDRFAAASGGALDAATLRRDVALEKAVEFERTATWRAVREAWRARHGARPPYARLPDIPVRNPKTGALSELASFVQLARSRHRRCLEGRLLDGSAEGAP